MRLGARLSSCRSSRRSRRRIESRPHCRHGKRRFGPLCAASQTMTSTKGSICARGLWRSSGASVSGVTGINSPPRGDVRSTLIASLGFGGWRTIKRPPQAERRPQTLTSWSKRWTKQRRKRIEKFIAPFRVKPGTAVTLAKDFDPAFKAGVKKKKEGRSCSTTETSCLPSTSPGWRPGHMGCPGGAPGPRRRGQGRDDPARDERRRSAGRAGAAASRCLRSRSSTMTSSGATRSGCPAAVRSGSSTAPITRRCWSSACIPRSSTARSCPETATRSDIWKRRYQEINDWERYLTDNGFRIVKLFLNLSKEEQRTRFLRRIDLPEHNWKFSAADVAESASSGMTTRRRSLRCSRTPAPSGHRGK